MEPPGPRRRRARPDPQSRLLLGLHGVAATQAAAAGNGRGGSDVVVFGGGGAGGGLAAAAGVGRHDQTETVQPQEHEEEPSGQSAVPTDRNQPRLDR